MQATEMMTKLVTAKRLMKEPVRNKSGEDIGHVEDYMLDSQSGCAQYAVLSFGGFLGIGEKLFAVPWASLMIDTQRQSFMLDIDKQALDMAPGFDRGNWSMAEQDEYRMRVDEYWNARKMKMDTSMPDQGMGSGMGNQGMGAM